MTFSDISNKIDGFGWMTEKIQISNNISTCKFYQIENATLIDEDKFYIFKSVISEIFYINARIALNKLQYLCIHTFLGSD